MNRWSRTKAVEDAVRKEYSETLTKEEYPEMIEALLKISMSLIRKAEDNYKKALHDDSGVKVLSVRFTYLMEKEKDELWFIGAENCKF